MLPQLFLNFRFLICSHGNDHTTISWGLSIDDPAEGPVLIFYFSSSKTFKGRNEVWLQRAGSFPLSKTYKPSLTHFYSAVQKQNQTPHLKVAGGCCSREKNNNNNISITHYNLPSVFMSLEGHRTWEADIIALRVRN